MNTHTATIDDIPNAWEAAKRLGLTAHTAGDFAGQATSETDPTVSMHCVQFFVPAEGGEVTADVLCEPRTDEGGNVIGDPWAYDVATGIHLSGVEVAALIVETI